MSEDKDVLFDEDDLNFDSSEEDNTNSPTLDGPPKEEGWYWFEGPFESPKPVEVQEVDDEGRLGFVLRGSIIILGTDTPGSVWAGDGRWAGPIECPFEDRGLVEKMGESNNENKPNNE